MASDDEERMRADWRNFVDYFRLFETFEPIGFVAAETFEPSKKFRTTFPAMSDLLQRARSFAIDIEADNRETRQRMILRSWDAANGKTFGWLCFSPSATRARKEPLADHRLLLKEFGGIKEWCRPQGDLCTDLVETLQETYEIDRGAVELYAARLRKGDAPIELTEWRYLAHEGNGDAFIVNPQTAEVLYLGHDVALKRAKRYAKNSPVYRLRGVTDFRSWVELIAQQHLDSLA